MPISALPTPPSRSDAPQDFSDRADALLGALPGFVTEANALQSDVNAKESSVSSYATIATDKAAEAQGYATTASTKASEAAASAIAAAAAASNAEIAFDSFDDKYLGSKANDPTTDNDGNALLVGALYWNTSVGAVRVWNGSAWLSMAADASIVDFQQAGAGAVVRTAQDKLREWVSVNDFGAVGDGVADDTAAIQAAISAFGGVLPITGRGTFRITDSLQYHTSGDVPGLVLDFATGSTIIADFVGDVGAYPQGKPILSLFGSGTIYQFQKFGLIRGINFRMAAGASNVCGIQSVGAWYYHLDRCDIRDLDKHGIYLPARTDLDANPDAWASVNWKVTDTYIINCLDGVHSQAGQGSAGWQFIQDYVINNKRHGYLIDGSAVVIDGGAASYNGKNGSGSGIFLERHLGVTPSNFRVSRCEIDSNRDYGFVTDSAHFIEIDRCRFVSKNEIHGVDAQLSHVKILTACSGGTMRNNFHRIDNLSGSTVTLYDFGVSNPSIASVSIGPYRLQNDFAETVVDASAGALEAAYGNEVFKYGAAGGQNNDYKRFVYSGKAAVGGTYASTATTISFSQSQVQTGWTAQHNNGTGVITIPFTGAYKVHGALTVTGLSSGARFSILVVRNGVAAEECYFDATAATPRATLPFATVANFTKGDTLEIKASCSGTGTNTIDRTNFLCVEAL